MKKLIYLLSIVFLQLSCSKTEISSKNDLMGKWKLTSIKEYKSDKITVIPTDKIVIVAFLEEGIIEETYQNTTPHILL
jgi:hypothetical protein